MISFYDLVISSGIADADFPRPQLLASVPVDLHGIPREMLRDAIFNREPFAFEQTVPSLMPPFAGTWLEIADDSFRMGMVLIQIQSADVRADFVGVLKRTWRPNAHATITGLNPIGRQTDPSSLWLGVIYGDSPTGIKHAGYVVLALDDDGKIPDGYEKSRFCALISPLEPQSKGMVASFVECSFFGIGLMHCKNIELVDTPMPPDKVRRKREKKLGRPLTQMKTLVLRPLAMQKRREGDSEKHAPTHTMPLHICRGHFATYSEDRPLFGKYAGTFWIPAHLRGTEEAGKVFKDYAIKAGGA